MDDVTSEQKRSRRRRWSRRRAVVAGLLVVFSLGAYLVLDAGGNDIDCSEFRFDATAWANGTDGHEWVRASEREEPTVRQRLADGLVECGTLVGKREAQLTDMLGGPDDYVAQVDGEEAASWATGIERNYVNIDNEHLFIRFDADGKATSAELVTD